MPHFKTAALFSRRYGKAHVLEENRITLRKPIDRNDEQCSQLIQVAKKCAKEISLKGVAVYARVRTKKGLVTGVFFQRRGARAPRKKRV